MGCCKSKHETRFKSSTTSPDAENHLCGTAEDTTEDKLIRKRSKYLKALPLNMINEETQEALDARVSKPELTEANKRLIMQALQRHMIFSSLTEDTSQTVIEAMKLYKMNKGETVFEQGCTGVNFYVVTFGKLEVLVNKRRVNILGPGDSFGEMALLQNLPRSATVKTLGPSHMWVIDRTEFAEALRLANLATYEENKEFIEGVPLFQVLNKTQRDGLISSLTLHKFKRNSVIVNEGDRGDLFYIIKEGTVSCIQDGTEIRRLYKGDYFGEQALLYDCTRTATCYAIDEVVKCLSVTRSNLTQTLGTSLQKIIYRNSLRIAFTKSDTLSKLTREQQEKVIDRMVVTSYKRGDVVIESGTEMGMSVYVVVKGALAKEGSDVMFAGLYMCVGDQEIMVKAKRTYHLSIVAKEKSDVAEISKVDMELALGSPLDEIGASNHLIGVLAKAEIFSGLSNENLARLCSLLTLQSFRQYEVIFDQGSRNTSFYIIKEGTVDIVKDGQKLRSVTKLDYFGERAILLNEPRSATVISKSQVTCWLLTQESFMSVVSQKVLDHLTNRMKLQDEHVTLDQLAPVKVIGSGNFGTVSLVVHKIKRTLYALKAVPLWKIRKYKIYDSIEQEKNVLALLDHMFILKSIKSFEDPTHIYFLTEFIRGMDMFDVLRRLGLVSDEDTKFYIASLILILEHLHERNIVYRDLKPENLIVDDSGYLKLVDFGTAKILKGRTYTVLGTPHYMSPEVILGKGYNCLADYWSLGVMLYELVCGVLPFGDELRSPYDVYEVIVSAQLHYPNYIKPPFPSQAIIEQLLSKNPASRLGGSVDKLKIHRWFKGFNWEGLSNKELQPPFVPEVIDHSAQIETALARPMQIAEFLQEIK